MKNSTTVWCVVGALTIAVGALIYLSGTTDFDRNGGQVAEVRTEAAEMVKVIIPETNMVVQVDDKPVVVTGTVAGKFE